jgi:hypothetical protein
MDKAYKTNLHFLRLGLIGYDQMVVCFVNVSWKTQQTFYESQRRS